MADEAWITPLALIFQVAMDATVTTDSIVQVAMDATVTTDSIVLT
jgi:hypothetical protein